MPVETIAVIGAGPLGRSLARAAALGGYKTILEDLWPASLRKAGEEMRLHLDRSVEAGKLSSSDAQGLLDRVQYSESVAEAARQADLVIEAGPDELESKSEIFILLDKICRPHTMLATTTLWLSVSDLASVTYRAGQCVGMRFAERRPESELVELIRGAETSGETLKMVADVLAKMGKQVSVSADCVAADTLV